MAQTRGGRYRATARARRVLGVVVVGEVEPEAPTRTAYASLGYRLLATEGFFVQRLWRVAKPQTPVSIEWVRTPDLAARLGKVTRTRPRKRASSLHERRCRTCQIHSRDIRLTGKDRNVLPQRAFFNGRP